MGKIEPAESSGEFVGFDYICSPTAVVENLNARYLLLSSGGLVPPGHLTPARLILENPYSGLPAQLSGRIVRPLLYCCQSYTHPICRSLQTKTKLSRSLSESLRHFLFSVLFSSLALILRLHHFINQSIAWSSMHHGGTSSLMSQLLSLCLVFKQAKIPQCVKPRGF